MAGMSLDEFWDSTPFELGLVLQGFAGRVDRWYEVGAFVAANIMNVWTKHRVTPKKLLPRKPGVIDVRQFSSREDLDAEIERRRKDRA
jgi:hypothetical protein